MTPIMVMVFEVNPTAAIGSDLAAPVFVKPFGVLGIVVVRDRRTAHHRAVAGTPRLLRSSGPVAACPTRGGRRPRATMA